MEHPFYTAEEEWVAAGDLESGDQILSLTGDIGVVESVTFDTRDQVMYNLTVDSVHTFAVGDGAWVVHNTCLKEYGGKGGGHHIHSKKAFEGHPNYDPNRALALPNTDMTILGLDHNVVTGVQNTLFTQLSRDIMDNMKSNILLEHNRIAVEALVRAGLPKTTARSFVRRIIVKPRKQGVTSPIRIPWN